MKKWIVWIILDLIVLGLLYWISQNPLWIEQYYVSFLYPSIAEFLSNISDRVSFSLTEIALSLAILWVLVRTITFLLRFFRFLFSRFRQRHFARDLDRYFFGLFLFASILFISFYLSWGINYFRSPLEEKLKRNLQEKPDENLSFSSRSSTFRSPTFHSSDPRSSASRSSASRSSTREELFSQALNSLIDLANQRVDALAIPREEIAFHISRTMPILIEEIEGKAILIPIGQKAKTLFLNQILDRTLIQGFVNPIFQEFHYNSSLTPPELPFTIAHEMAHLYGYAQEGEANFLGYLACIRSKNQFLQFSGLLIAIRYFLSDLSRRVQNIQKTEPTKMEYQKTEPTETEYQKTEPTETEYTMFLRKLDPKIIAIYQKINERHKKYQGRISKWQSQINDLYLKVNQVPGGIENYSKLVEFILQYPKLSGSIDLETE